MIAPLTANTMARLAHGLADDVLTEAALAHDGPVLVAPAMNTRMWEHPATQANLELLVSRGVETVGPASGELAEGEVGIGPDGRAGGDRGARRGAAAALGTRSRADTSSSTAGGRASRSTPSASSATAPRDGWGPRSPTRRVAAAPP